MKISDYYIVEYAHAKSVRLSRVALEKISALAETLLRVPTTLESLGFPPIQGTVFWTSGYCSNQIYDQLWL